MMAATGRPAAFNNAGTLIKTVTAGSTTFDVAFNNSGMVDVETGTLNLADGSLFVRRPERPGGPGRNNNRRERGPGRTTTNVDQFKPLGTVLMDGAGTAGCPATSRSDEPGPGARFRWVYRQLCLRHPGPGLEHLRPSGGQRPQLQRLTARSALRQRTGRPEWFYIGPQRPERLRPPTRSTERWWAARSRRFRAAALSIWEFRSRARSPRRVKSTTGTSSAGPARMSRSS